MSAVVGRTELRPRVPEQAEVGRVRVAPDGRRLAFARHDGDAAGVYVDDPAVQTGPMRLVAAEGWRVEDLVWSPDGSHLAYLVGGGPPPGGARAVGWVKAFVPGEIGRIRGSALAWSAKSSGVLVADLERQAIVAQSLDPASPPSEVASIDDDGDPHFPPHIAPSPDGSKIVFTCRRVADSVAEVWLVTQGADRPAPSLLTQIPGEAVHVLPFWSPRGVTLGLFMVHLGQSKSGLVVVPRLEGEGELLYDNPLLDDPETPAWSPGSRWIALFHTPEPEHEFTKSGPSRLVLLDTETHDLVGLTGPNEVRGTPRFIDEKTLVVDGGEVAHVLTFAQPL